jgi:O-antigen ligase
MTLLLLLTFLSGLGWLIPNHYLPWLAAWGDGASIAWLFLCGIAALTQCKGFEIKTSRLLLSFLLVAMATIFLQTALGKIMFRGDGLMAALYVAVFFISIVLGFALKSEHLSVVWNGILWGWIAAASISVFIGVNQWLGVVQLGIFGVDLSQNMRPFGNLAQPNNFCTICFIGLCSTLLIRHRTGLHGAPSVLLAAIMLLGMASSQSRTGILQILLLLLALLIFGRRLNSRVSNPVALLAGGGAILLSFFWREISSFLLLPLPREFALDAGGSVRLSYWWAMTRAVLEQPIWGYGWNQVGMAQQYIALNVIPLNVYFDHAHNIVLDLLLWSGVPVGVVLIVVFCRWLIKTVKSAVDFERLMMLVFLGGVLVHGMLELPLEYAYILVPVGLMIGRLDEDVSGVVISRKGLIGFFALMGVVFLFVSIEYFKMEEGMRTLRIESAKIGVSGIKTTPPQSTLLDQLEAFQQFAATEAKAGMSEKEIERMRKVALRYGYPPVLFRYALALGLNGDPEEALKALRKICAIHSLENCEEAKQGWKILKTENPVLRQVDF